jgi:hypothetical protein
MKYADTAHNRSVYAAPPFGGSGFRSPRSVAALLPTAYCTHILPALQTCGLPILAVKTSYTAGTLYDIWIIYFIKKIYMVIVCLK